MKEALKLALEALEDSEDHLAKPYSTDARRAITAIKEALAQHDVQHTGNGTFGREADVRPTGFFFQMPKPAQEPVACAVKFVGGYKENVPVHTSELLTQISTDTPAQRTWVGLTDDEIEGAIDDGFAFGLDDGNVSNEYVIRYARAIEQALKEKNK